VPRRLKPRAIAKGATLGIAAPGGPIDAETLAAGCAAWEAAGFRVRHRDDLCAREGFLAGSDERRASELAELVADPRIDAIVCARGGYGLPRILDRLDPRAFRAARKPLVGYSDVTALLLWLQRRAGLVAFHGPMLERGADADPDARDDLIAQLGGAPPRASAWRGRGVAGGSAEGRLVGGNLELLSASLRTPWELDTRGAVLMIEEVHEKPYRIDRKLQQLRVAGKLETLAGLAIGALTGCEDPRYPEPSAQQVLIDAVRPLGIPVVVDLPFGHTRRNYAWPFGVRATLDGDSGELRILERGVVQG
jgi:muramoyltetrapeptide carboxypeptidase